MRLDASAGESSARTGNARTALRAARASTRRRRRQESRQRRGQTLIIFALSFTVLLSLAGLAIDVARAYDLYARMQRAAEAGALAGVLYMPGFYNTARTPGDGLSAVERASAEVVKDGFGTAITSPTASDCPTPVSSVEVAICAVPNTPTDLEVFITEHMDLVLLSGLGLNGITLQAKAQADYLPPVQIGSRENYFGDAVECSSGGSSNTNTTACQPTDTGVSHLQYFMATMNGPAELKETGDPYVYCAEGDSQDPPDPSSGVPPAYNGYPTNHPQWAGVVNGWTGISQYCGRPNPGISPGNQDFQPDGYTGPATATGAHPGGYNYFVGISQNVAAATLWIYNPFYIPQDTRTLVNGTCTTTEPLDRFNDGSTGNLNCPAPPSVTVPSNYYQGPKGEGLGQSNPFDGTYHDAPLFFFNVTYSLYSVSSLYDRNAENAAGPIAAETFPSYDGTTADLSLHGCATDGSQVYDPYWQRANTPNDYYQRGSIVNGGTYHTQGCTPSNTLATGVCPSGGQWCQLMNCGAFSPLTTSQCQPLTLCGFGNPCTGGTSTGAYRLVVEASGLSASPNQSGTLLYNSGPQDGWGTYTYALKVCQGNPSTAVNCSNGDGSHGAGGFNNSQVNIYGWNNVDAIFQQPLDTQSPNANFPQTSCVTSNADSYACLDLGCLTSSFAGRTLTLRIFDPGDGSGGDMYVGVAAPYVGAATIGYPSGVTTTTLDGDTVVQTRYDATGYRPYNGQWLNVTLHVASSFNGDCFTTGTRSGRSGWFQLAVISPSTTAKSADTLAVEFTLVGSPVHLTIPN